MDKAVFWDFDGTLTKSQSLWSNSLYKTLCRIAPDLPASFEDVRRHTRGGFTWHTPERDYADRTGPLWWESMYRRFSGVAAALGAPETAARQIGPLVRDEILQKDNYALYGDAPAALQSALDLGYRNYILSNNYPELERIVEALGLTQYFSGVIASANIGFEKPRPEIFEHALRVAGHPELAVMVGDNPIADIQGAARMGLVTILVHRIVPGAATHNFGDLSEAITVLETLANAP